MSARKSPSFTPLQSIGSQLKVVERKEYEGKEKIRYVRHLMYR